MSSENDMGLTINKIKTDCPISLLFGEGLKGGAFIMAETTTPRLMAAAKEFNIGKDTLVDFLAGKGFSRDDLKPTSKLTEDMYRALQAEFQSDKVAKLKSDQIDLPKGAPSEAKRKK